jgi:hypothetical protein
MFLRSTEFAHVLTICACCMIIFMFMFRAGLIRTAACSIMFMFRAGLIRTAACSIMFMFRTGLICTAACYIMFMFMFKTGVYYCTCYFLHSAEVVHVHTICAC